MTSETLSEVIGGIIQNLEEQSSMDKTGRIYKNCSTPPYSFTLLQTFLLVLLLMALTLLPSPLADMI